MNKELAIGEIETILGVKIQCVEDTESDLFCENCYFNPDFMAEQCFISKCSSIGRTDGKNVYFIKVEDKTTEKIINQNTLKQ
jgi:hypothetical protein